MTADRLRVLKDEGGMQALDTVMVVGVAAGVVALVTRQFWPSILAWFVRCIEAVVAYGA